MSEEKNTHQKGLRTGWEYDDVSEIRK